MFKRSDGKRRRKSRSKRSKRCRSLLGKKIGINIHEGIYANKAQAIAVAYSQVRKRYPSCRRILGKKSKKRMRRSKRKIMDGVSLSDDEMKKLLQTSIEIIKLKSKSVKWTPTEENYITEDLSDDVKTKYKEMLNFLVGLHRISLNLSIKPTYRGYEYPNLIEDFRKNAITNDLVSDDEINKIKERWVELVKIKDKVSKLKPSVGGEYLL
jgi:hypothetical protein